MEVIILKIGKIKDDKNPGNKGKILIQLGVLLNRLLNGVLIVL